MKMMTRKRKRSGKGHQFSSEGKKVKIERKIEGNRMYA